mgnify:CR=1 FL=1
MPFQNQREEVGDRKVSRLVAAFLSGMNVEISAFVHMSTNSAKETETSQQNEVGEEEASSIYISIQGSLLLSLINSSVSKPKKRARKKDLLFL